MIDPTRTGGPTRDPRILPAIVVAALLAVTFGCGPGPPKRIVLVVVDTLRRDHVSGYGGEDLTPNLEAFAGRGLLFTNAYASFHQTTMSMGALFTGRTPSLESEGDGGVLPWTGQTWCGMFRFAGENPGEGCLPPELATLGEAMKGAGYWTAGIVSNPLLFDPAGFSRGFDEWVEIGESYGNIRGAPHHERRRLLTAREGEVVTGSALATLARRRGDRFFLYVHYMDVHDYGVGRAAYAESVRRMDTALGKLLRDLERKGLLEEAFVVVTSDHGERLGEKHVLPGTRAHFGNPSFEQLVQIPLIVFPPPRRDPSAFLRLDEVHRLLLEIAGVDRRPGPDLEPGELLLTERRFLTYRRGRHKSFLSREDGTLTMVDLEADPGETADIADRSRESVTAHGKRVEALRRLLTSASRTDDRISDRDLDRLRSLGYLEDGS